LSRTGRIRGDDAVAVTNVPTESSRVSVAIERMHRATDTPGLNLPDRPLRSVLPFLLEEHRR